MISQHVQRVADNAHVITYASAGGGLLIWGLQIGDIAAMVSIFGVISGVAIQLYNTRLRAVEKRQAITETVVLAGAAAQRAQGIKSAANSERIAALESDTKS